MNLNDYQDPNAPCLPRHKASQAVARAKRAAQPGRPAHDTEPITPLRTRQYVPFGIGALVLVLLMIGAATYQLTRLPAKPMAVTPGPSVVAFLTAPPAASPEVRTATIAPERTIGAYAAPDGLLLGQIEENRIMAPVAHYGAGWIQAQVEGSGLVWLRADDVPDLAIVGPDLAPVAAAAPQTGQGLTFSQDHAWSPLPPPTPAPEKGEKEAPDRAARHATAVARDKQPHGSK